MNTLGSQTTNTIFKSESHKLHNAFTVSPIKGLLTFAGDVIASNVINVTINGVAISPVTYADSHANTMALLVTALKAISTVSDAVLVSARVIEFTPVLQTSVPVVTATVTLGQTQTTITPTSSLNDVYPGMPVKLNSDGEVKPADAAEDPINIIGVSIHQRLSATETKDKEVTVAMKAYIITEAQAGDTVTPGPVKYDGYDTTTGRNKYKSAGVTYANIAGWALTGGSTNEEIMVALT